MSFDFQPAVRENVSLLLAFAGPSGSGKTYSALRVARGLAAGAPIFFIDTEARRGLHYADEFKFLHADMRPPFRPERFVEGIHAAENAGAKVVIIDSFSHEYDGEGGILDWAADIESGGTKPPGNWKIPKLGHKKLMNALLQCRASIIFCLRADEKIAIEKREIDGRMKTVVVPLGWVPICEKRFMYEQTASFTLTADNPGRPNFCLPHKLQQQHRGIFPEGEFIDERAGEALAAWAAGGKPQVERNVEIIDALRAQGERAAAMGMDALQTFWGSLIPAEKKAVGGVAQIAAWKKLAAESDAKREIAA